MFLSWGSVNNPYPILVRNDHGDNGDTGCFPPCLRVSVAGNASSEMLAQKYTITDPLNVFVVVVTLTSGPMFRLYDRRL